MTLHCIAQSTRLSTKVVKLSALTAAILIMQSNSAAAATSDVLSIIDNIANASYIVNNQTDNTLKSESNRVRVKASVLSEYGINLSKSPRQTVAPGNTASWVNVLTSNSYNVQTVDLRLTVPDTLSNIRLYQDLNNNGIVDDDDKQLLLDNLTAQIRLGQGESIQLIVQALTAADATDGDLIDIQLGATVVEDPSVKAVIETDSLVIVENDIAFTDDTYENIQTSTQAGKNVYIETSFAQCNFNATKQDYVWVTFASAETGDSVKLKALEVKQDDSYNTGKYQVLASTQNNATKISGGVLKSMLVLDVAIVDIKEHQIKYFKVIIKLFREATGFSNGST